MMRPSPGRLLVAVFVVAAVAAVAAGFAIIGPPWVQREIAIDQRRTDDLNSLRWEIEAHWQEHERLPETLADLGLEWVEMTADPETGALYEYETTGARSYRLCASFTHQRGIPAQPRWMGDFEMHGAGRHCFDIEVPAD